MRAGWFWRTLICSLALTVATAACKDPKQKVEERQRALEKAKKEFEEAQEAKQKAAAPKIETAKLDPPWDDPTYLAVATGKPCPEGLWSLFTGPAPGEGAEQVANEARRAELEARLRKATFVAKLPAEAGVKVHEFNAKRKHLPVEVDGLVECIDKLGVISLAWGEPAKAYRPPSPADEDEALVQQSVWRARPLILKVPMKSKAEATAFKAKHGLDLDARLVFTLGKVDLDKHVIKSQKPLVPDAGPKDAAMDWGAGRLVHVNLVGVRLGTDHEKTALVENLTRR